LTISDKDSDPISEDAQLNICIDVYETIELIKIIVSVAKIPEDFAQPLFLDKKYAIYLVTTSSICQLSLRA
jgi:hypothetical protein